MKRPSHITKINNWFLRDTPAIALDIFRIPACVLSVTYFYSLISDVPDFRREFKRDLRQRMANKYCRELEKDGKVRILTKLKRITPDNIDLRKPPDRYFMSLVCYSDKPYKIWEKPLSKKIRVTDFI